MRLIDEILNDINQAKQKITSVELEIGHASGPSKQIDTLIGAENLLTYCHSRLSDIDPESLRPQGEWTKWSDDKFIGYGADGKMRYRKTHTYECCFCGRNVATKSNYCPNCGAKMKGAENVK